MTVWAVDNYMFKSTVFSSEFINLMVVYDIKPNTCKIVFFVGFKDQAMIKLIALRGTRRKSSILQENVERKKQIYFLIIH